MTNRTKITLAAALIAAFATPALAQDSGVVNSRQHSRHQQSYTERAPRFVEGRNAAVIGYPGADYGYGNATGRDAMVQSLGN